MAEDRMGAILLQWGRITAEQLEDAVALQEETGRRFGEALVQLGYASDDDVGRALAAQLDLPFFDLGDEFRMEKEEVGLLPESIATRYGVIAIKRDTEGDLTLVMRDPLDMEAVDNVRSLTRMNVHKAVSTEARISAAIEKFYRVEAHIERDLRDIVDTEEESAEVIEEKARSDSDQLKVLANDAPVVRFVNLLLMQAVRDRASDIHFEPGERDATVRIRVDGLLRETTPPPRNLYQAVITRIKILSSMDITERRLPLDGRFKFKVQDRIVDVRVSSLPEVHGEKIVMRLLDRRSLRVNMKDVGFEEDLLKRFQAALDTPHGIILVTGPTGSGKTTTLYAALSYLKDPKWNIQTVEDPVEYLIPGINQMQTKAAIKFDFAEGLRAILRQDPDIIMIGEIRDQETARIAMRASLTGHLVLSTLHTNDAPAALWRLRDIGIESYLVAATMRVALSQRLVRVICPDCKRKYKPSEQEMIFATTLNPAAASWEYKRGVGCRKCERTGFYGRKGIFEYLEVNGPVREMILQGETSSAFRKHCIELGMETLAMNGMRKVAEGTTSISELMVVCAADEGG